MNDAFHDYFLIKKLLQLQKRNCTLPCHAKVECPCPLCVSNDYGSCALETNDHIITLPNSNLS